MKFLSPSFRGFGLDIVSSMKYESQLDFPMRACFQNHKNINRASRSTVASAKLAGLYVLSGPMMNLPTKTQVAYLASSHTTKKPLNGDWLRPSPYGPHNMEKRTLRGMHVTPSRGL